MAETRRATVYFSRDIHRALTRKAAQAEQLISRVVNDAVRLALNEDDEDFNAFRERADEPNLDFESVVKSLRRRGKI